MGLIERQAMAPLRDRVFLSLSESSAALSGKAGQTDARPFQKRDGSRESERLGQEKDSPVPLPAHPYRIIARKPATAQLDYHVSLGGMSCSTPLACLRKRAEVSATPTAAAIAVDGERVATHPRLRGRKGQYPANPEHMPDAHRDYAEWNGERFRRWAAEKGPATAAAVDAMPRSRAAGQQAWRTCRALLDPGRRHGDATPGESCAKAPGYARNPSHKTARAIAAKLAADAPGEGCGHAYLRGSDHCEAGASPDGNEGVKEEWS